MPKRISVALATYNGADYIKEQMGSTARQDLPPDELVVCDDSSSDDTIKIVRDFSEYSPFPVHFEQNGERLGIAGNFEKAISLCRGDLIFSADQDDVWFPSKLRTMRDVFDLDRSIGVAINDAIVANEDLSIRSHSVMSNMRRARGSEKEFIWGCCTAITREFRDLCIPFPTSGFETVGNHDDWFHFVGEVFGVRRIMDQPLQYYRRHGANSSDSEAYRRKVSGLQGVLYSYRLLKRYISDGSAHNRVLEERLRLIDLLLNRFKETPLHGDSSLAGEQLKRVEDKRAKLERRVAIGNIAGWRRFTGAVAFLISGGYRDFRGLKSFLTDVCK